MLGGRTGRGRAGGAAAAPEGPCWRRVGGYRGRRAAAAARSTVASMTENRCEVIIVSGGGGPTDVRCPIWFAQPRPLWTSGATKVRHCPRPRALIPVRTPTQTRKVSTHPPSRSPMSQRACGRPAPPGPAAPLPPSLTHTSTPPHTLIRTRTSPYPGHAWTTRATVTSVGFRTSAAGRPACTPPWAPSCSSSPSEEKSVNFIWRGRGTRCLCGQPERSTENVFMDVAQRVTGCGAPWAQSCCSPP